MKIQELLKDYRVILLETREREVSKPVYDTEFKTKMVEHLRNMYKECEIVSFEDGNYAHLQAKDKKGRTIAHVTLKENVQGTLYYIEYRNIPYQISVDDEDNIIEIKCYIFMNPYDVAPNYIIHTGENYNIEKIYKKTLELLKKDKEITISDYEVSKEELEEDFKSKMEAYKRYEEKI